MTRQQDPVLPTAGRHRRESDALALDASGSIGALEILTGPDRDELEIEISPVGDGGSRTRDIVRAWHIGARVVHVALFARVPAGEYVVWHDESTPAGTVVVRGGEVAHYRLT